MGARDPISIVRPAMVGPVMIRPAWVLVTLLALALLAAGAVFLAAPAAATSSPPTTSSVTVTRGDGTLNVSWAAVDGATSYNVNTTDNGKASWSRAKSGVTGTSAAITGVTNSKTYYVAVQAVNSNGNGGWTDSAATGPYTPPTPDPTPTPQPTATPAPTPPPPGAPSSVIVTRSDGALNASWDAVAGASKYHVTYSADGKRTWTAASDNHTGTTIAIDANNGKTYYVSVRAGNAAGWSGWTNSPASAPMTPPPAAPSSVSVTRADGTLTASWDAVSGATGYHVTYSSNGKQSWTAASGNHAGTGITISGVDNAKTYYVAVRALNGEVGGPWTNSDAAGPFNPPAAPTGLSVTPGDGYYDVAWNAVTGATGYDVRAKTQGSSTWHDVTSNATGTSYRYTTSQTLDHVGVRARNAAGESAWTEISRLPDVDFVANNNVVSLSMASAQSGGQIASSKPAKPTSVTITRENYYYDEKLFVNWSAVTGATGYNVVCSDKGGWKWWACGTVSSGSTTTYTVDRQIHDDINNDLKWRRSYRVAVQAVKNNVRGDWTDTEDARPAFPPALAYDPISVSRAAGSVSLSWTPPPYAQGYEIDCATYATPSQPHTPSTYQPSYTRCADVETATVTNGKINVTISSWTAGGTDYSIDDATTYDIRVRTTNAWGSSSFALAPLIYPNAALTASNVGATTATLTVGNHTAQWWYKANASPHTSCQGPVAANTAAKDLTGLSANTSYTYKAYSARNCASADEIATATAFTTLSSVSNLTSPTSNYYGSINSTISQAVAFTTGSNAGGYTLKSITLPLSSITARTGLGLALRAMQGTGDYSTTSQPASTSIAGVTFSGTDPTTSSYTDTTYTCSGSGCKLSPDTTYFVVATNADSNSNGYRWAVSNSETEVALPSNNGWSIGYGHYTSGSSWTTYDPADWSRAGFVFATDPSLTSSNLTSSGATLTIANHDGDWYYKATSGPHTSCSSAQSGTTATLTGLTGGTAYTYSAYSDSGCATLLATASAFTTPLAKTLAASNVGATTARLTVGNHTAQWWYKANVAPHTTCQGPVAANTATEDLTGLSANTTYTYKAYSATGCASANEIATASAFTTFASTSNLGSSRVGDSFISGTLTKQATAFTTGSNAGGYTLKTATIPLKNTSGSGGLTVTLHAMQGTNYGTTSRPSTTTLATLSGTAPTGSSYTNTTWTCSGSGCDLSPNTTYFIVANRTGSANYAWNYARPETETRSPSDNGWNIRFAHDYIGSANLWSSTSTEFNVAELVFQYKASLTASNVTTTGATLTIGSHSGNWYYKANAAPHNTCQGPVSGASKTLTGLTTGTAYTYKAYSDSGCTTANLLATASEFTPQYPPTLTAGSVGVTNAALTIGNHTAQWWYKANVAPHTTCQGPVAANTATKVISGLTGNTSYTYKAYGASGCASANLLATAASFRTGVSASNMSETNASTALNFGTDWGQEFTTGSAAGGYKLQSVTLDFGAVANASNITVSIRERQSNNHPATTALATLTGTPAAGQVTFNCSGAGCNLDASTTYFVFADGNVSDPTSNMRSTTSNNQTLQPSNNGWSIADGVRYAGGNWALHSSGVSMKVEFEALVRPSLTSSSVSSTGATLTISSEHSGAWYYKADTGPHTSCQGPVSGSSVTLSGLTGGTTYTYTAYSDSTCTTANELAAASAFTTTQPPPNAPSGLNLSFNSGLLKMQATWSKPSGVTGAVSYEVQHADSDRNNAYGGTTTIAATSASTVTHTFNNTLTVKFRVRAVVNGVKSAWAEHVS